MCRSVRTSSGRSFSGSAHGGSRRRSRSPLGGRKPKWRAPQRAGERCCQKPPKSAGFEAGKAPPAGELLQFPKIEGPDDLRKNRAHRFGPFPVVLCYVESEKTSSNFRPQQWQKPIHRSNHGRILPSVCSHVTPEVFFVAQVDDRDKQIRQDGQDQVVMKPAPTAPLEVIQTQIGLCPLEILFDVPA